MVIHVRRAIVEDAAGISHVHVDTWRSTYRGMVSDEYLSNLSYERSQRMWEANIKGPNAQVVLVADDSEKGVIGFAACGPARDLKDAFKGELYAVYVLRDEQGRGVGRRLVLSAGRDLIAHGLDSMLVWVLADNPSRRFYEHLGGEKVAEKDADVGGRNLRELAFGWRNLTSLISALEPAVGNGNA